MASEWRACTACIMKSVVVFVRRGAWRLSCLGWKSESGCVAGTAKWGSDLERWMFDMGGVRVYT